MRGDRKNEMGRSLIYPKATDLVGKWQKTKRQAGKNIRSPVSLGLFLPDTTLLSLKLLFLSKRESHVYSCEDH